MQPLPHASVDGLSGLAEILVSSVHVLADLADELGLEVDDLLPLVDAFELLGFASSRRAARAHGRRGDVRRG